MAKIKVDIDGLRESAATLDRTVADMEATYSRLTALIAQLEATWDGAASEAYVARLRRDAKKVKESAEITKEFAKYGRKTAERFESIDRINKMVDSQMNTVKSIFKGRK